ncbi:MAG: ABC transporter ATP-binding protein [Aeriscardovia sp.]|nr:ABC transporter ATP-binding protein [Aeriscardovia sp.]
MSSIRYEDVSFRYSKKAPLTIENLSLEVEEGEFLAVVGSSGCGKSTFLRLAAGLEKPESGKIYFDGKDFSRVPTQKRDVSMVFQSPCLYPHLDAAGNIAIALKIAKEKGIEQRVRQAAKMCGIEGLLSRLPSEMSGGQRQRVAIARAIVRRPGLFLMDEPLSSLDSNLRFQMRREIKELQRSIGTTSIYVTHDQAEALTMADRIAVMREGKIEQVGTPEEVYSNPANTFVASFMGQPPMNLVEEEAFDGRFLLGGFSFPSPLPSGKFIAGFRPENAKVEEPGPQIKVLGSENMGKEFWLRGSLIGGEGEVFILSPHPYPLGSQLSFSLSSESFRYFDPSGLKLS